MLPLSKEGGKPQPLPKKELAPSMLSSYQNSGAANDNTPAMRCAISHARSRFSTDEHGSRTFDDRIRRSYTYHIIAQYSSRQLAY
jgi:hypothetical protein